MPLIFPALLGCILSGAIGMRIVARAVDAIHANASALWERAQHEAVRIDDPDRKPIQHREFL